MSINISGNASASKVYDSMVAKAREINGSRILGELTTAGNEFNKRLVGIGFADGKIPYNHLDKVKAALTEAFGGDNQKVVAFMQNLRSITN